MMTFQDASEHCGGDLARQSSLWKGCCNLQRVESGSGWKDGIKLLFVYRDLSF